MLVAGGSLCWFVDVFAAQIEHVPDDTCLRPDAEVRLNCSFLAHTGEKLPEWVDLRHRLQAVGSLTVSSILEFSYNLPNSGLH